MVVMGKTQTRNSRAHMGEDVRELVGARSIKFLLFLSKKSGLTLSGSLISLS